MAANAANCLWMAALLALWMVVGLVTTPAEKGRTRWVLIAALALCVRFLVSWSVFGSRSESTGTDGLLYHKIAIGLMDRFRNGTPVWQVKQEFTWYTFLLGVQYAIFGANRYAGAFMNAFYAVLGGQLLLHTGLSLGFRFGKASLISAAWLFMPNLVVWTSDTRKEAVSFLFAFLLWRLAQLLLRFQEPAKLRLAFSFLGIGLLLWVSTLLRIYMLVPLGGGLAAAFLLNWLNTRRRLDIMLLAAVLAAVVLIGFLTLLPGLRHYGPLAAGQAAGGAGESDTLFRGIAGLIGEKDLARAANGFFTSPHLSEILEISDLQGQGLAAAVVAAEMILWYLLLPASVFGMMEAALKKNAFLVGMAAFIILYSFINILVAEEISDTYYRYRAFIVAPVLLFSDPVPTLRRWFPGLGGEA
jgi:hypothetical protein